MAPYATLTTTLPPGAIPQLPQEVHTTKPSTDPIDQLDFTPEELAGYRTLWGTFRAPIKWFNATAIIALHLYFVHGLIFQLKFADRIPLIIYYTIIGNLAGLGTTGGAHRLWCHKSYKATLPVRIFLMLCYTMAGQNSLHAWVRDHRVHHKYSETDADPHNANRGFFFAHCGWLMLKKHPKVIARGNQADMSDLNADPVVQFHEKYFVPLKILIAFVLPSLVPIFLWNETVYWAFASNIVGRYVINLNITWSVNSAAHIWGSKPYDKRIQPVENVWVAWFAMGEGWHNYHHTFPWDYKASELAHYINVTTIVIDGLAKLGMVYDRKTPSADLIRRIAGKNGDGSHPCWGDIEVAESEDVTKAT